MTTCYITFGHGTPLGANFILKIEGDSETSIRIAMNRFFKSWCGIYDKNGIDRYIANYGGEIHQSKATAEDILAEWKY